SGEGGALAIDAAAPDANDVAPDVNAPVVPDAASLPLRAVGTACPAGESYGEPLPANPALTMVKGGFSVTEGPVWHAGQQALYFSEFEAQTRIHKYTPADGTFVVFADKVGVNGL